MRASVPVSFLVVVIFLVVFLAGAWNATAAQAADEAAPAAGESVESSRPAESEAPGTSGDGGLDSSEPYEANGPDEANRPDETKGSEAIDESAENESQTAASREAPPVVPRPIPRRPQSAEEMLQFFDIDESLLRQLIDHRPLHSDENEVITNILFALPKLPADDVIRWVEKDPDWDAVIADPQQYRTKMYRLTGVVRRVERVTLVEEVAERFEFGEYYQADVELGEDKWNAVVLARHVPRSWKIGETIHEAVSFYGMFLKLGDRPVFATTRLAWHPNRLDNQAGITEDHVFLGDLGMDVGLWDEVKDKHGLLRSDRECFYQLLAAMKNTRQENLREKAQLQFEFADLLRHPEKFHGRLMTIEGTARRAAKIIVGDDDIRDRLGIDHYYEVYVFVRLDKKIVFKKNDESLEFSTFPVVFCVRDLPAGMPEGDDIHQAVRIPGVYFKLWSYESVKMSTFDPRQEQPCPMLVALQPDLLESEVVVSPYIGMAIGGLFIVALFGVWIGVWRFGREDARFERETLKRQFRLDEGKSLDDMGLEAKSEPDFSHLE